MARAIKTEISYSDGKNPPKSFNPGDEDAFEQVLTSAECERLKAKGAIEGDWTPKVEDKPKPKGRSKAA